MAAVDVGTRDVPTTTGDDLDDLFDYNVDSDIFRNVDTSMDVPTNQGTGTTRETERGQGTSLGIDEEVKVVKRRAPIPKLDENRLLSQAGIPKLRKITKERLKFKGKGHEYSDVARLLNLYQLWLDDLYPRAKFADGLAIIEKLGHSKRMQIMRKEWISEGKPREKPEDALRFQTTKNNATGSHSVQELEQVDTATRRPHTPTAVTDDPNDLYDATPRAAAKKRHPPDQVPAATDSLFVSDDEGGHDIPNDDLDALLAEGEAMQKPDSGVPVSFKSGREDDFEDEMEAMEGLDW